MFFSKKQKENVEPVLLCTASDGIETELTASLLIKSGIPVLKKQCGAGDTLKVYMGANCFGTELYVPPTLLETAKEILAAKPIWEDENEEISFILRKWEESDAPNIQKYANNRKIAHNLRDSFPYPYTLNDAKIYIKNVIKTNEEKQYCRAIDIDGEAIGSIGIFIKDDVYCKSAEIGYWLGEPFWGHGIMTNAIKQICEYSFENYDLRRIFAEVYAYNTGSKKVLEKAGFTLEGTLKSSVFKNGKLHDSCLYALVK